MAKNNKQRLIAKGFHLTPEDFNTELKTESDNPEGDNSHLKKENSGNAQLLFLETSQCTTKLGAFWPTK